MDLKGAQNDIHLRDGYCHVSFNTSADLPQGLRQQYEVKIDKDKNEDRYKDEDIYEDNYEDKDEDVYEDNYDDEDEDKGKDSDLVTFLKNSWAEAAL